MCFRGRQHTAMHIRPPTLQPPPQNTPVPPGSDSFQRFQEIRRGMLTGNEPQLLQDGRVTVVLGQTKGSNVTS